MSRFFIDRPIFAWVLAIIIMFVFFAITAPFIAPYGPLDGTLANRLRPPNPDHWFGTDLQGRDELSRVLYGARVSLVAAIASVTSRSSP